MPTITPCLWFDTQAEEAAELYTSVFPNSRIVEIGRYTEAGPGPAGSVMIVVFELDGQRFSALNGGPAHAGFTETISFQIECRSQEEVDRYWEALTDGGEEGPCGWLKDRFGLSWQVVPVQVTRLLGHSDPATARRVSEALFRMRRIDIAALEEVAAA